MAISTDRFLLFKSLELELYCVDVCRGNVDHAFFTFIKSNLHDLDEQHLQCALALLQELNEKAVRDFASEFVHDSRIAVYVAARALFNGHFEKGWITELPF